MPFSAQRTEKLSDAGTVPLSVSVNVRGTWGGTCARAGEAIITRAVTRAQPAPRPMIRFITVSPSAGRPARALRGRRSYNAQARSELHDDRVREVELAFGRGVRPRLRDHTLLLR